MAEATKKKDIQATGNDKFKQLTDDQQDKFLQANEDNYEAFERTLAIIKPNAFSKAKAIEGIVKKEGLMILKKKRAHLKPDYLRDFFIQSLDEENNKYYRIFRETMTSEGGKQKAAPEVRMRNVEKTVENSNIEEYVDFMTGGPVQIWIVAGRNAVSKWLDLLGPADPKYARLLKPSSIRARFGGDTILRNGAHGSENPEIAEEEIKFFFPKEDFDKDSSLKEAGDYLSKTVNPILLKGLIQMCRQKPDNPLVWLADWLLANNPYS